MTTPLTTNPLRIGVLGGTFDPIHIGHLILAEEACYQLQLDFLYLVPAGDPPHKQDRTISSIDHRLSMLELAIQSNPHLRISLVDVNRPGPHYTVETMQILAMQLTADLKIPPLLFFLMGLDSLRDLPTWHNPQWLIENCQLVVFHRPDVSIDWHELDGALPGVHTHVTQLDMPLIEISSSDLRHRVAHEAPIRYQVPHAVEQYIVANGLYTSSLRAP